MKLLTNQGDIQQAISRLKPSKIAVAYVGAGWEKYVSREHLKEIIVSPTEGSNPFAIEGLMAQLGDDNVFFLNKLHAKIYLGETSAVVGSCNLTYNGIGGGLQEAAVLLEDEKSLKELNAVFNQYKNNALALYPDWEAKIKQLKQLKLYFNRISEIRDNAIGNKVAHPIKSAEDIKIPTLRDYVYRGDTIHIVWYGSTSIRWNRDAIKKSMPETSSKIKPEQLFYDWTTILESDEIEVGAWVLNWKAKNDGIPYQRLGLSWVYVDNVIPHGHDGNKGDPYTKVAAQLRESNLRPQPFLLDGEVSSVLRAALALPQFSDLRSETDDDWHLAPADTVIPAFFKYVRQHYDELLNNK